MTTDIVFCKRCGYRNKRCPCGEYKIVLDGKRRVKISKFLSGLLRHFPEKFNVVLDKDGWAELSTIMEILKRRYGIDKETLELIVKLDEKERFEIRDNKIRARYGHTVRVNINWSESPIIPKKLYHGTSLRNLKSIMSEGIKPMRRLEVHMVNDPKEAYRVALRHGKDPIILEIDTSKVIRKGIKIRKKGKVYTADYIPPDCISFRR